MTAKSKDAKGRWRSKTIAFRLSPQEDEEINARYKLSGFQTKQEFILQSLLYTKIKAVGTPLMMLSFRKYLQEIIRELKRIDTGGNVDEEIFVNIRTMLDILDGFEEKKVLSCKLKTQATRKVSLPYLSHT